MPSSSRLSDVLKEFLTPHQKSRHEMMQQIYIIKFVYHYIYKELIEKHFNCAIDTSVNSGSMGCFTHFTATNMKEGFSNLQETLNKGKDRFFRIKKNVDGLKDSVGIKFQVFFSKDKYFEARTIREETILQKLSKTSFREYIPLFYLGFTVKLPNVVVNQQSHDIGVRITFMENLNNYTTLSNIMKNPYFTPNEDMIAVLAGLLANLWKQGISHNDIKAENIMGSLLTPNKFKIIDFGLATVFLKNQSVTIEGLFEDYTSHYEKELKRQNKQRKLQGKPVKTELSEQLGSNVRKFNELVAVLHNRHT